VHDDRDRKGPASGRHAQFGKLIRMRSVRDRFIDRRRRLCQQFYRIRFSLQCENS
jgi:hypothetical protein